VKLLSRHLRRERMEIVFVGLVIFVDADAGRGGRRQKNRITPTKTTNKIVSFI
jgi:hypothetical protein